MTHPEQDAVRDLAAAYALDALAPEEAARFERLLSESPEARREVAEYRDVAAMLALAAPEAAAGPGPPLRGRILSRIAGEGSAAPGRRRPPRWGALAAGLLLAAGLCAALLQSRAESARLHRLLARTGQALAAREATLDGILAPGVEMYQLTASGDPDPGIQLFWDRRRNRAVLHGYRLRPAPPGHAYQLWFIRDGTPVPSVTFKPEAGGQAKVEQVEVPAQGGITAAAVTIEPETGSPQPTSPVLLVGPLQRS